MPDRLDFEIAVELEAGLLTGHAGVPGLIEAFRQTGTAAVIEREGTLRERLRFLCRPQLLVVDETIESFALDPAGHPQRREPVLPARQCPLRAGCDDPHLQSRLCRLRGRFCGPDPCGTGSIALRLMG